MAVNTSFSLLICCYSSTTDFDFISDITVVSKNISVNVVGCLLVWGSTRHRCSTSVAEATGKRCIGWMAHFLARWITTTGSMVPVVP